MSTELKQYQFTYVRQADGVTDYLTLMCADEKAALQAFLDDDPDGERHFMAMEYKGAMQVEATPAAKDRHGMRVVR